MKDIVIDFGTRQIINGKIEAIQGDNTTKKIKILLKENSLPYNLTGKSVMLTMKKNSSNSYVNKGDFLTLNVTNATSGEIELPIDKNFTKEKGGYQLQLSVLDEFEFEENSILFESIIHTNLKEEISGTLVESVIFKEIKQTLQEVKDVAKNEQARQEAEILRESNEDAREKAEKLREEKINTFDARVTKNTENITQNRKDIERTFEVINDSSFLPFEGQDITIEHSKVGFTKELKVEGMIYQNLLTENQSALIKPTTDYTFIPEIVEGVTYELKYLDNTIIQSDISSNIKITTLEDVKGGIKIIASDGLQHKNMLFEGDYTQLNTYIPPYFEGIKSVGEKENKISILSHGKNLFNGISNEGLIGDNGILNPKVGTWTTDYIELKKGIEYIRNSTENNIYYDKNKNKITDASRDRVSLPLNCVYVRCVYKGMKDSFQLEEGTLSTSYEPYKEDKKEILLPYSNGLKGFLNGAKDTIILKEDGLYIIQKVGRVIFDGDEEFNLQSSGIEGTLNFYYNTPLAKSFSKTISNKFVSSTPEEKAKNSIIVYISGKLNFYITPEKLETQNVAGFKKWLQTNPTSVYYELAEPIEYKIADLNSLNLETYKNVTYVSSDNEIKSNLSFKAPADIPATISTLKSTNAMLMVQNTDLQNKNNKLEDINKKQTTKIIELDDTTNFLIEDALSRKINNN